MRLICPVCQASYNIPDAAIGPQGRMVACAKCKHQWHAVLPDPAEANPPPLSIPESAAPAPQTPSPEPLPPPANTQQFKIIPAPEIPVDMRDNALERQKRIKPANLTPVIAARPESATMGFFRKMFPIASLSLLCLLLTLLIMARSTITQKAPGMLALYNVIGISPLPPGGGLSIANVRDESRFGTMDNALILSGEIINQTPAMLKVPLFKMTFTTPEGQSKTFMARGPIEKITGGQTVPFRIERPGFAQSGWNLKLSFGDGSEGNDTGKALQTVDKGAKTGGEGK